MFITKKYISRREVLRGVGVTLSLPLLDAMVPAQTPLRKTAATPRSRLACIEMVHGAAGSTDEGASKHYWSPEKDGTSFDFSYSLEPLAPFREYVTIISGTDARQAEAFTSSEGGADHFRSSAVFLTAAHAKQTAGPDILNGPSIDQIYAQQFGKDTVLPSLQLCADNLDLSGSCGFNYSCVYSDTISWASPTAPLPMTMNPRAVFESLFGYGRTSILDGLAPAAVRMRARLGAAADKRRLNDYLEEVRGAERRIQAIERHNASAVDRERPSAPLGVPDSWEDHVKLMFDLQVLAFAAEITRVSTFKMSHDTSLRVFPESGVGMPFHSLSHHSQQPALIAEFAKLNRYHVSLIPYFLRRLKETREGDGNLLDSSLILYGSPMGDSNTHNHRRLPLFLAGRAGGQLKGNLHRACESGTPQANCLLTVMRKLGVEIDSIGDSTGEIEI